MRSHRALLGEPEVRLKGPGRQYFTRPARRPVVKSLYASPAMPSDVPRPAGPVAVFHHLTCFPLDPRGPARQLGHHRKNHPAAGYGSLDSGERTGCPGPARSFAKSHPAAGCAQSFPASFPTLTTVQLGHHSHPESRPIVFSRPGNAWPERGGRTPFAAPRAARIVPRSFAG